MRDFVGRGSGKGIEEGIEECIRQNIWQSEVGDGLFGSPPLPSWRRTPPAEIGEGGSFSPLQSKERTKVMYKAIWMLLSHTYTHGSNVPRSACWIRIRRYTCSYMSPRSQFVDATLLTTSHYIRYYIRTQASRVALLSTRYHLCNGFHPLPTSWQPCSPAAPSSWRCRLVAGPSSTSALLRQW